MVVNAVPEVFRYDFSGSYTASIITTAMMILVSIMWVKIRSKNIND